MANARDRNRELTTTTGNGREVTIRDLDDQIARLREVLAVLSQAAGHKALGAGASGLPEAPDVPRLRDGSA